MLLITNNNITDVRSGDYVYIQGRWDTVLCVERCREYHELMLANQFFDFRDMKSSYYQLPADKSIACYLAETEEEIMQAKLSCC